MHCNIIHVLLDSKGIPIFLVASPHPQLLPRSPHQIHVLFGCHWGGKDFGNDLRTMTRGKMLILPTPQSIFPGDPILFSRCAVARSERMTSPIGPWQMQCTMILLDPDWGGCAQTWSTNESTKLVQQKNKFEDDKY